MKCRHGVVLQSGSRRCRQMLGAVDLDGRLQHQRRGSRRRLRPFEEEFRVIVGPLGLQATASRHQDCRRQYTSASRRSINASLIAAGGDLRRFWPRSYGLGQVHHAVSERRGPVRKQQERLIVIDGKDVTSVKLTARPGVVSSIRAVSASSPAIRSSARTARLQQGADQGARSLVPEMVHLEDPPAPKLAR